MKLQILEAGLLEEPKLLGRHKVRVAREVVQLCESDDFLDRADVILIHVQAGEVWK